MIELKIKWERFADCNDNPREAFETMCRRLFIAEYLNGEIPRHNPNNKGIEVQPILEPPREDGRPRKWISFQSKYTQSTSLAYREFLKSAKITAKEYSGKLNLVYLFSNNAFTVNSNSYKELMKIHKEAGIEIEAVDDTKLLDIVRKYPDIVKEFFSFGDEENLPRTCYNEAIQGVLVEPDTGNIVISPKAIWQKFENNRLLKELVKEKISTCRSYACSMELDALRLELQRIFSFEIENVDGVGELYFFKLLLDVHDGNDVLSYFDKCSNRKETEWIIRFYNHPYTLSNEEFLALDCVTQVFVVDKLFTSQFWKKLLNLYNSTSAQVESVIKKQFGLYYGLALFNLQNNEDSSRMFHRLYETEKEERFLFYAVCAEIKIHNNVYRNGYDGKAEELISLLDKLETYVSLKQYDQQRTMVAAITMESYYHLGMYCESAYTGKAIEVYNELPETIRENKFVLFYYAICSEMEGNKEDAMEAYSKLDWKSEPAFAERYMLCCILNDQVDKAVEIYGQITDGNLRLRSICLFALDRMGSSDYKTKLEELLKENKDDIVAMFNIAYFVEDEKIFNVFVMPILQNIISAQGIGNLRDDQSIQLAVLLSHFGEIELLETVLNKITDTNRLNRFALNEIYGALLKVANREYIKDDKNFDKPSDFIAAERIADMMLRAFDTGTQRARFLNIKVLCSGAKKLPFSSLKYSKELFLINMNKNLARNIVGLLIETKERNYEEYKPYIEILEHYDNPSSCMVVANAMLFLGKKEAAEYFAYKSLYLLNGEDDINVFRYYFGFWYSNMRYFRCENELKTVQGGTVVILKEADVENPESLMLCLDSEAEFRDAGNRSMNVEHIAYGNIEFTKLCGSGLKQIRNFRGKKYIVEGILTRIQFGIGYVYRKMQENPELFKGFVLMIKTEDAESMIKQIQNIAGDREKHLKSMLEAYHFKDNELGLPIDFLSLGDYNKYIDGFRYLLFAKDEAFYTGQPVYEDEPDTHYVPALSTLVLIASLDRFDVLEGIKKDIIIPESYITFFKDRYNNSFTDNIESKIVPELEETKTASKVMDKYIYEIWETVLNFCCGCNTLGVSNEERVAFEVVEGFSGEYLMSGFMLDNIHLDSLIIAKREDATYLCDDLFFRKIASNIGVRNLNSVSIAEHYNDIDMVTSYMLELSKTNYIYIPLLTKDDRQAQEMYRNLMTGEKKRKYYTEVINMRRTVQEHIFREIYGDEYTNKLLGEKSDK